MINRIPHKIDHFRYTDKAVVLDGQISKAESDKDLLRLKEAIVDSSGDIVYQLEFGIDYLGNRYVQGRISAQVIMQCQRCLHDFQMALQCDVSTAFVQNEAQQRQAEESNYDVFWLPRKEYLDPRVLIEDELLLALPQIAMHPLSEIGVTCKAEVVFLETDSDYQSFSQSDSSSEVQAESPFAVLKQLKNNK